MTLVDELYSVNRTKQWIKSYYEKATNNYKAMRELVAPFKTAVIPSMPEHPVLDETAEYKEIFENYRKRNYLVEEAINENVSFYKIIDNLSNNYKGWRIFLPVLKGKCSDGDREIGFNELEEALPIHFLKPSCGKKGLKYRLAENFENFVFYNPIAWSIGSSLFAELLAFGVGAPNSVSERQMMNVQDLIYFAFSGWTGIGFKKETIDKIKSNAKHIDRTISECYKEERDRKKNELVDWTMRHDY